jgi:16S rRNA (adenine1518-N6/adenine1519-N6)-dimethyltransferase
MVRAKKSLGQHFLRQPALLAKIAAATGAGPGDVVLEIGPGEGGLTEALLHRGAMVVAIERDERMLEPLRRRFAGRDLVVVAADALAADWSQLVMPWTSLGARWLVVGNIPYYITSPLLEKALTIPMPASVTFLVQQEVADRIVAPAGADSYGALSVNLQAVAEGERLFTVGRGAFVPPPKVDSSVLQLIPRAQPLVTPAQFGGFRRLVTSLFSYRRKRLHRALREATGLGAEAASTVLACAKLDPDVRPERLTPAEFVRLLDALGGQP